MPFLVGRTLILVAMVGLNVRTLYLGRGRRAAAMRRARRPELAAELFLSEPTVKTHVTRILAKLQLRDRVHAVVLAYECGLIRPGAG